MRVLPVGSALKGASYYWLLACLPLTIDGPHPIFGPMPYRDHLSPVFIPKRKRRLRRGAVGIAMEGNALVSADAAPFRNRLEREARVIGAIRGSVVRVIAAEAEVGLKRIA